MRQSKGNLQNFPIRQEDLTRGRPSDLFEWKGMSMSYEDWVSETPPDPVKQARVEAALRPFLPELARANPVAYSVLTFSESVEVHYEYWIAYFARPMLAEHKDPHYPPDVAQKILSVIATLRG